MSIQAILLVAIHLPLLYWLVVVDRFSTWNEWADWTEANLFPPWLRWDVQGDRVTWLQHGLTALGFSLYGGALSIFAPERFVTGAVIVAWFAFVGYVVREGMAMLERLGKPNALTNPVPLHYGWVVDGIMDTVGPLLVAVGWTVAAVVL